MNDVFRQVARIAGQLLILCALAVSASAAELPLWEVGLGALDTAGGPMRRPRRVPAAIRG
ncbi:hypothetical protein [Thiocapsa bogorovii]|uniref:hypothetical protein n=1 Tax=Thiocapsa bogorovii TaxID=521689 RepID=UPI001E65E23F|nr:hypothetical protein [Thiocapsa bogorovii]UHD18184.1 hypothetical protein LT988_09170 [Thiocapsa bogorovii]